MNQKYLIALIVVFFSPYNVEKVYGCHHSGQGCKGKDCGAKITDASLLSDKKPNITIVASGDYDVQGLGHFIMHDDTNNSWRFLEPRHSLMAIIVIMMLER